MWFRFYPFNAELDICYIILPQVWQSSLVAWHSCLSIFAWRRAVLRFLDPKYLLRVSCILWCYISKWFSIFLKTLPYCSTIAEEHRQTRDLESRSFWHNPGWDLIMATQIHIKLCYEILKNLCFFRKHEISLKVISES